MTNNLQGYSTSPTLERHSHDRNGAAPPLSTTTSDPLAFGQGSRSGSAIVIRRLSRNISSETLSGMLIFSGDLVDTEFVRSPYPEDEGFATAVARFQTQAGALDAQQKLHGKPNTTKDANMIVEIHSSSGNTTFDRRNTIDGSTSRTQTSSASSAGSRSRFGNAFQSPDKVSPPLPTPSSGASSEFPVPETSSHFQNLFSPQSPLANGFDERQRMSGKYTINNDAVDDETGELLKDPVAYARNGQQQPIGRRQTSPQFPVGRFASLSLSTSNGNVNGSNSPSTVASPQSNGMTSPRAAPAMQSPMSPTFPQMNYPRHQYPPVNPADQNPPCNTLYVGNLPLDTSEDELKAVFSKQRGYKRLCFRTKQNGPMCFVEFEDVSFATKALNELYGHPLHNSVKGGIRLSFSKNPLGVRSGQVNGMAPNPAMNPHAMAPGFGVNSAAGFSSVSGPPPGLVAPPGLINSGQYRAPPQNTGMEGMFANPFGIAQQNFDGQLNPARAFPAGMPPPTMNGAHYGRDSRPGYNDYMLGR